MFCRPPNEPSGMQAVMHYGESIKAIGNEVSIPSLQSPLTC